MDCGSATPRRTRCDVSREFLGLTLKAVCCRHFVAKDRSRNKHPLFFERHGASRRFFAFHQPVASAIPLSYFLNGPKDKSIPAPK